MSEEKKICGIVMPISPIDGCDEGHWNDVYEILKEAILLTDFEGNLVSYADDVGIIQKRIIQNLYDNPIVICDVSGYGHGVGMNQYGANGMAKEGSNYKEILTHYYKNCEIKKIN